MEKPPRPIQFCHPTDIQIRPMKWKNNKPFWSLSMKHGEHHLFCRGHLSTFVEVMKEVNRQFARSRYTDEQIYREVQESARHVLTNEWAYRLSEDGRTYNERSDKHEWHFADEVNFARWYLNQQKEH